MKMSFIEVIMNFEWANWITAISAFASMVILFFYTFYTNQMQKSIKTQTKELIYQRKFEIMPSLLAEISSDIVIITNIGNGTALNLSVLPRLQEQKEIEFPKNAYYDFELTPIIRKGESKKIPATRRSKISERDPRILNDEIWNGIKFVGILIFQDIEGSYYKQDLIPLTRNSLRHGFPKPITVAKAKDLISSSTEIEKTN